MLNKEQLSEIHNLSVKILEAIMIEPMKPSELAAKFGCSLDAAALASQQLIATGKAAPDLYWKLTPIGERFATLESIVADQGNGMSYCGSCHTTIDIQEHYVGDRCPNPDCNKLLLQGQTYLSRGGSDF